MLIKRRSPIIDFLSTTRYFNVRRRFWSSEALFGYNGTRISVTIGRRKREWRVWEAICNGSPAYIYRKHLNDIRFIRPTLVVNVEAERRLRDVIKVIEEVVEDSVV